MNKSDIREIHPDESGLLKDFQKANPAVRLYQRVGYEVWKENEEDWIMVKNLTKAEEHGVNVDKLHTTLMGAER